MSNKQRKKRKKYHSFVLKTLSLISARSVKWTRWSRCVHSAKCTDPKLFSQLKLTAIVSRALAQRSSNFTDLRMYWGKTINRDKRNKPMRISVAAKDAEVWVTLSTWATNTIPGPRSCLHNVHSLRKLEIYSEMCASGKTLLRKQDLYIPQMITQNSYCFRSLSCEVHPGKEGICYFGDDRGHVLSQTFTLKDAQVSWELI